MHSHLPGSVTTLSGIHIALERGNEVRRVETLALHPQSNPKHQLLSPRYSVKNVNSG